MTITRDIVTDLLPVYFSGEASADTRRLVEEFFGQDAEFERIARRAARPVELLHQPAAPAPDQSRELAAFEQTRRALRRQRLWFGFAILFTCLPLAFGFTQEAGQPLHLKWFILRDQPWEAVVFWAYAAVCWWMYARRQRVAGLVREGF
jgi:anti-sigma factor RsiW